MHHDFLDRYSRIESPVHRMPAGLKAAAALFMILIVVLLPITLVYHAVIALCILILVIGLSKIPPVFFIRRILFFEPFIILIAALTLLQPEGWIKFSSIIVKSTLSLVTVILLSNTTPFTELLGVLRRIHTPPVIVTMVALMYRYIFVLVDETQRMRRARQSRTFTKGRMRAWYFLSNIIGQLFIRSTERAERIFAAMSARGWR
ncbi:MAG: cobalt ECF transporter T component CbiQ [Bacteroidota bacterium]